MNEPLNRADWLTHLRAEIDEVTPAQALGQQANGAWLIDVREDAERASGSPLGATGLSRGFLELRAEQIEPNRDREVLTLCASGQRSLLAAETLLRMGYRHVRSVTGGFTRWQAEGLPVASDGLDTDAAERYARQLCLPQVGIAGQAKLSAARVVVIGAGGLGAPLSLYLAAAGVGHLCLIDDDRVERSNLHRQIIHADARVGMAKTESARMALLALNPRIDVDIRNARLRADNVETLLGDADIIVDGADNFPTRYLLAAASVRLQRPMVYGAVERFSGQASVFDPRDPASPCYRCLFAAPPPAEDAPNCSEAGVLGVLPGLIGMIQATEVLKLILGIGQPLIGRLLLVDALAMHWRELRLPRDPECPGCGTQHPFNGYHDIEQFCRSA
ncbi:MAG: molybdopterin-synthase adenylyltransferase MoeB [Xanthomonadales bacterium]|nr:molybdopterin-synthase adenylyltransferase MoeB [Xanthomonadales bacterium]